ncbi:MAG TPA: AAA family ATPase [Allosphingosinicella sp.]|jgi:exopolysaccharide/PEP-CTERM locus tyrosine autokinase
MKHTKISLLERAAEVYDFGAALRARAPLPIETAPEPAPAPEPSVAERARRPVIDRALSQRYDGTVPVDREALSAAGFILPDAPVTGLAEEFRLVKRQLLASIKRRVSQPEEKRRSVLISSAQSGEGKSFCAINMALSLAGERDVEVLLVDADFSKPDVLRTLGIAPGPGLVDALADPDVDPEDFVIRTELRGLSVLPAGAKANNVPELLASERTREVLSRLAAADRKRIILFDSPPALMASPAPVLAAHVGQVLVIVRADQTTEADLRETIGLLSGCDHVGLILNAAGIAVTGRKFGSYDGYGQDD